MKRYHHKHGKAVCDRCDFVYKLNALRYEWTGLKVCPTCWDPLPAQDHPRAFKAEQEGLWDPRPERDRPAGQGLIHGEWEIIGRDWLGTDLGIIGGEATLS